MDDNIGAGRTLDKYFFQPTGRFIERIFAKLALRLHITPEGVVVPVNMIPGSDNASLLTGSSTSTMTDNPCEGNVGGGKGEDGRESCRGRAVRGVHPLRIKRNN